VLGRYSIANVLGKMLVIYRRLFNASEGITGGKRHKIKHGKRALSYVDECIPLFG